MGITFIFELKFRNLALAHLLKMNPDFRQTKRKNVHEFN